MYVMPPSKKIHNLSSTTYVIERFTIQSTVTSIASLQRNLDHSIRYLGLFSLDIHKDLEQVLVFVLVQIVLNIEGEQLTVCAMGHPRKHNRNYLVKRCCCLTDQLFLLAAET